MRIWLRRELENYHVDIIEAYLFGSVLSASSKPRDIDLVLVTADNAGEPAWQRIRHARDTVSPKFLNRFGLPLSILVLTPSEWRDIDGVIVREREPLW